MSDHKHGEMNVDVQEKTFEGFITWTKNVTIIVILVLVAMALFRT